MFKIKIIIFSLKILVQTGFIYGPPTVIPFIACFLFLVRILAVTTARECEPFKWMPMLRDQVLCSYPIKL